MRNKDKLYTVNKWNYPLFMPTNKGRNLFALGDYIDNTNFNTQALYQQAASYNPYQGFYDINNNSDVQNIMGYNNPSGGNIYVDGTFAGIDPKALAKSKAISQGITNKAKSTRSNINWGNVGKTAAGIASLIPESEMTIGGTTFKRGLWDAADPVYHLANGRESEVGNTLSDIGVGLTKTGLSTGQWYLALAGAGVKILGGLANAGWGIKGNKENIAAVEKSTDKANQIGNILGQASTNEDILALSGRMSNGSGITDWNDLYENGWFTNEGTRKGKELINKEKNALGYQNRALLDATGNVARAYNNAILAHYSAYGGPLYNLAMNNNNNDMGAIEYGFMSDYLASKKAKEQNQEVSGNLFAGMPGSMFAGGGNIHIKPSHRGRLTELKARTGKTEEELYNDGNPAHKRMVVFARNARKWKHGMGGLLNLYAEDDAPLFAFGGDLNTHGSDFPTGLTHIDAGGTHEENPNEGVPMGFDPQGNPNLVEEGEVIYDNYVFSNRISIDDAARKSLGLKGKDELSYANAAKKLEKIVNERPNDPISKETFKVQMGILREEQERQKNEMETAKAREAFNALSPEEQIALMEQSGQQPNMNAYGGNLFLNGGQEIINWNKAKQWLAKEFPNIDPSSVDNVARIMVEGKDYGNSFDPEKAFKKIVPTNYFSESNIGEYLQAFKEAGIPVDDAMSIVNKYNNVMHNVVQQERWKTINSNLRKQYNEVPVQVKQNVAYEVPGYAPYADPNLYPGGTSTYGRISTTPEIPSEPANTSAPEDIPAPEGVSPAVEPQVEEQPVQPQIEQPVVTVPPVVTPPANVGGINPYAYYTAINDYNSPTGFTVGEKGIIDKENGYSKEYLDLVNTLGANDLKDWVKSHSDDLSYASFINNGNKIEDITDDQFRKGATDGKYGFMHHVASAILQDRLNKAAAQGNITPSAEPVPGATPSIPPVSTTPSQSSSPSSGNNSGTGTSTEEEEENPVPKNRWEGWRYAGLAGPVVGLGMMSAGIGKPNYKGLDAVLEASKEGPILAQYRPLGNYMRYTPMDIYAAQAKMNAQARATDRAIMNGINPGRYAGLIASGYNSQLASGELLRQALAYNNEQRQRVAEFNRGTDQANADAAMRTSQFNADAINRDRQYRNSLAMNVAQQKLEGDASWYNSLYGNINQLFKGASELGRENAEWNMISALGADTVNFGDSNTGKLYLSKNNRKRKNKNSGTTTIG